MANKKAAWANPEIIKAVDEWWHDRFDREATGLDLFELYDSYYEYMLPPTRLPYRLNLDQFAKCLMAAKIMDIGGRWRQAPAWNPTPDQIRRVTA